MKLFLTLERLLQLERALQIIDFIRLRLINIEKLTEII
jgi:hypothetical protein